MQALLLQAQAAVSEKERLALYERALQLEQNQQEATAGYQRLRLKRKTHLDTLYQQALVAWQNDDARIAQKLFAQVVALEPRYRDAIGLLYRAVTGTDVIDMKVQLEREEKTRQQVESTAQEEAAALEAEIIQLQIQVEIERETLQQLEIAVQQGAEFRRQREKELEQLRDELESGIKARERAKTAAKKATNARTVWAVMFGISTVLILFLYVVPLISGVEGELTTSAKTSTLTIVAPTNMPTPTSAALQESEIVGVIVITALKLRSGPSTDFNSLKILNADDPVMAIARDAAGDWVLVRLPDDGTEGWVPSAAKYVRWEGDLSKLPDETEPRELPQKSEIVGIVNVTSLSLRSGPSIESVKLETLLADDPVTAVARDAAGDWVLVRLPDDSTEGWVSARYVEWDSDVSALLENQ